MGTYKLSSSYLLLSAFSRKDLARKEFHAQIQRLDMCKEDWDKFLDALIDQNCLYFLTDERYMWLKEILSPFIGLESKLTDLVRQRKLQRVRCEISKSYVIPIFKRLTDAGIRALLSKGEVYNLQVFNHPIYRNYRDFDLWLLPNDVPCAHKILLEENFDKLGVVDSSDKYSIQNKLESYSHLSGYVRKNAPVMIEIHQMNYDGIYCGSSVIP